LDPRHRHIRLRCGIGGYITGQETGFVGCVGETVGDDGGELRRKIGLSVGAEGVEDGGGVGEGGHSSARG